MSIEEIIKQVVKSEVKILNDKIDLLLFKIDNLKKGKITQAEFKKEESGFSTIKELSIEKKCSIKTIKNYLKDHKKVIERRKVAGRRENMVNTKDFDVAWEKGRTSFNTEVFNKQKSQKAA